MNTYFWYFNVNGAMRSDVRKCSQRCFVWKDYPLSATRAKST